MKVLAINGSPRKGGNTEILLKKVLESVAAKGCETDFVQVGGTRIRGCTACGACRRIQNKRCVIDEDVFNPVFEKVIAADAVVIGSPSYFGNLTAETKALIDRMGYVALSNGNLLRRKIGVAVSAERRGGGIHVMDSINHLFLMTEMIVPGSTYWNFGMGTSPGDVLQDEEGLRNMENLGEQIAWLLKLMEFRKLMEKNG